MSSRKKGCFPYLKTTLSACVGREKVFSWYYRGGWDLTSKGNDWPGRQDSTAEQNHFQTTEGGYRSVLNIKKFLLWIDFNHLLWFKIEQHEVISFKPLFFSFKFICKLKADPGGRKGAWVCYWIPIGCSI
jgi:hypothetical protein